MRVFRGLRCSACGAAITSHTAHSDREVECFTRTHGGHGDLEAAHFDLGASAHLLGHRLFYHELSAAPGITIEPLSRAIANGVRPVTVGEQHALPGGHAPGPEPTERQRQRSERFAAIAAERERARESKP